MIPLTGFAVHVRNSGLDIVDFVNQNTNQELFVKSTIREHVYNFNDLELNFTREISIKRISYVPERVAYADVDDVSTDNNWKDFYYTAIIDVAKKRSYIRKNHALCTITIEESGQYRNQIGKPRDVKGLPQFRNVKLNYNVINVIPGHCNVTRQNIIPITGNNILYISAS